MNDLCNVSTGASRTRIDHLTLHHGSGKVSIVQVRQATTYSHSVERIASGRERNTSISE
jgi:hypothetical protein